MGTSPSDLCHRAGEEPVGYRVLSVHAGSPGANTTIVHNGTRPLMKEERINNHPLVPYFDFIISINGKLLNEDNGTFIQEIKRSEGKIVEMEIFNAKCGRLRVVQLIPQHYGGSGMLGLFVRFDTYLGTRDNILRVLEVKPSSPAQLSGLTPLVDYILAADDCVFECIDDFGDYLIDHEGETITLFVYNADKDAVREVSILLTTHSWGDNNETGLGLSVGTGHLHALPNQETTGSPDFMIPARDAAPVVKPTVVPVTVPHGSPQQPLHQQSSTDETPAKTGPQGDEFCEVPLSTPVTQPVDESLRSNELPSWNSDDSDGQGDSDGSQDSNSDVDELDVSGERQLQFVDDHAHAH